MIPKGPFSCITTRLLLTFLTASGVMELYLSRTNLSIAIVAMVRIVTEENKAINDIRGPYCTSERKVFIHGNVSHSSDYYTYHPINESVENELISDQYSNYAMTLTTVQRGNLLSALFYSYPFSSILGGRLSDIYGAKKVFGIAVMTEVIGNLLTPVAARTNYWLVFIIRVAMGMAQGAAYPAINVLAAKWIPPKELNRFTGFVLTASSLGTVFSLTIYGFIISTFGWEYVFYVGSLISLCWVILWTCFMFETPEEHPRISEKERDYIINSLSKNKLAMANKPNSVPWLKMMTCLPIWAVSIAHAGSVFGMNFGVTQLPLYMDSIIGVNIKKNGILSSFPFLVRFLFANLFSFVLHWGMKKVDWSAKTWKRLITLLGFGGPACALLSVGYVGCNTEAVLALFVIGMALNGATLSGHSCNFFELSPNFVGTITGVAGTIGYLYTMIGPIIFGALTPKETLAEWKSIYWILFINYAISGIFYCMFVSTEIQPWNHEYIGSEVKEGLGNNQKKVTEKFSNLEKGIKADVKNNVDCITKL